MFPIIPKPAITRRQKALAIGITLVADFVQLVLFPVTIEGAVSPVQSVLDIIVAILLTAICGFRWQFIVAFFLECVPGLDLFPTWTAVALLLPTRNDSPMMAAPAQPITSAQSHPPLEVTAVVVPPRRPSIPPSSAG